MTSDEWRVASEFAIRRSPFAIICAIVAFLRSTNMAIQHDILKKYWGFDTFRPAQEDVVQAAIDGMDTLAMLPTGGGKSLCFQVLAWCFSFVNSLC